MNPDEVACLTSEIYHRHGYPNQTIYAPGHLLISFDHTFGQNYGIYEEVAPTLKANGAVPTSPAVLPFRKVSKPQSKEHAETWEQADAVGTLTAHDMTGSDVRTNTAMIEPNLRVRRLTPVECERLQGFPDNYTQIPWKGKTKENCPDGQRFKVMGNSMAVPVMRWLGKRIQAVHDLGLEGMGKKGVAEWL